MSLDLEVVDPRTDPAWDKLLEQWPGYSIFHSAAWARVLTETYQYQPKYGIISGGGKIRGLLPLMEVRGVFGKGRGVSLPFSDFCDPLLDRQVPEQEFIDCLIRHGRFNRWKTLEFHGGSEIFKGQCPSSRYLEHRLDLIQGEEAVRTGMGSTTRRNIRKAVDAGIQVQRDTSADSVQEYYRLHCLTRKHHGVPPQPFRFFKKIYEHVISKEMGAVFLGYHEGKAVAGAVYFHLGEMGIYKFGASDRNYLSLRANHLVMWEAIRWYCRKGFKQFSFGRTDLEDTGLRQFKKGWGTQEKEIRYYKFDLSKEAFEGEKQTGGRLSKTVLRRLPVPLLRIIGTVLYRYAG